MSDRWYGDAVCAKPEHDPRMWDGESDPDTKLAKQVCLTCPVINDCLRAATPKDWGVWGGLHHTERDPNPLVLELDYRLDCLKRALKKPCNVGVIYPVNTEYLYGWFQARGARLVQDPDTGEYWINVKDRNKCLKKLAQVADDSTSK